MLKQFWILTKNVLLRILFKGNTFKNSEFKIIQYLIKVCKTETSFLYHVHNFASELAPISTKLIFLVMYIYGKHARWLRKEASIVDISKKGEWHKASAYCPVPLTPCIMQVTGTYSARAVMDHYDSNWQSNSTDSGLEDNVSLRELKCTLWPRNLSLEIK